MSAESEYTQNQLNYRRSKGVAKAWDRERELVRRGRGTRQWTVKEQKELLDTGRVKGYQGHHMKSVSKHPEEADNPKNIQFLRSKKGDNEHLRAHKGDYHNESNGRYNPKTDKIRPLKDDKVRAMNSYELKNKAIDKRGYTKYAANQPDQSKDAKSKAGEKKAKSTEFNGKSYGRAEASSQKRGTHKADSQRQSSQSRKKQSDAVRYGDKTSQNKAQRNNESKGNYGEKASNASKANRNGQAHGNYGHSSGSQGQSSGSQGHSSGGRGHSSGGQGHGSSGRGRS